MPLPTLRSFPALRLLAALLAALLALASCGGGDIIEIGIVERFDDPAVDEARDGFLQAMDAAGYKASEQVRYFRFNAEGSEFSLDEIVEELVVEEDVDVLLAIGSDALRAAIRGASGQAIFFALATDDTIGGASDGGFRHGAITGGSFAHAAGLVEMASLTLPSLDLIASSRLAVFVVPDELDSVAAARLGAEGIIRSGLEIVRVEVTDAGSVEDAVREAADADVAAIALTPSALLDDALEGHPCRGGEPGHPRGGDAPRSRGAGRLRRSGAGGRRERTDRRRHASPLPRRRRPQRRAALLRHAGRTLAEPTGSRRAPLRPRPDRLRRRGRGHRLSEGVQYALYERLVDRLGQGVPVK